MVFKHKAFTMIEMIVVISVILILTAFAIYSLGPARAKSRDSRRITDANLLMNALDQYYTSNLRTYPTQELPDTTETKYYAVEVNKDSFLADSATLVNYLSEIPEDPIGGEYRYVYVYRGDGKKAAVIVDKLESMTSKCNANEASLPEPVKAYKTGSDLIESGVSANDQACYYVAR